MHFPVDDILESLNRILAETGAAVLQAPPGAGKTTRVPPSLLDAPWLGGRRIIMLEPRRLAARSAARYMASRRGEQPGETVGYRTRLETRVGAHTRIEVVTEGVLTRLLQADPELSDYGAVIFDEFHERSLQADLGLALVREVRQALRPDLRLLVMSATLDAAPLAALLGDAPVLASEGRSYPVTVQYRAGGRLPRAEHCAGVVSAVLADEPGSVLVFLPGTGEIRRLAEALVGRLPADVELAPLYGDLSPAEQDRAIAPAPTGRRKLVLATDIAQTSLTIEGIRVVVDAGLERRPEFDPNSGMTRLQTHRVSRASADQRAGRAGRLSAGSCYRLWAESERLAAFSAPEMVRADLSGLVLELAQWGCRDPHELDWLDPPPAAAWARARELLQWLDALDGDGGITATGRAMQALPLPPRLAHMVVRGRERGLGRLAAELAALLAERDPLARDQDSDLHRRLQALRSGDRRFGLVREAARRLIRAGDSDREDHPETLGALLALGWPDRIAVRRQGGTARFRLSNGRGAFLPGDDVLADRPWLVAPLLDGRAREARIFLAAPVNPGTLEAWLPEHISERERLEWDTREDAVVARRERCLGELVLDSRPLASPPPEAVQAALLKGIRGKGIDVFPWTPALRQFQARVALMRSLEPERWPDLSDRALLDDLSQWALPFLVGITRLAALSRFPLAQALRAQLDYPQQQRLAEQAPEHWLTPAGSGAPIDYLGERAPALRVKLQEMFGQTGTPTIAGGRVSLTLELLSPAQRPVAVTGDLTSFWTQGYAQVRKDLRGRYPKHPWPEDPLTAPPRRGTKKQDR